MIGLGRMGANMAHRLAPGGHAVFGFDVDARERERLRDIGARSAVSLVELVFVSSLAAPRASWLMLQAAIVDATLAQLLPLLAPGDRVVDGGNSIYKDSMRRAADSARSGIAYVDCGTRGGIWDCRKATACDRRRGGGGRIVGAGIRDRWQRPPIAAWGRVGPAGAGHFSKMVQNRIEYGLMQAYAEGFAIMQRKHARPAWRQRARASRWLAVCKLPTSRSRILQPRTRRDMQISFAQM